MLSDKVLDVILEDLNLKKDEEFEVRSLTIVVDGSILYRINKNGLECFYNGVWNHSVLLDKLLLGKLEIVKLQFIPKLNEMYYYPDITSTDLYDNAINYNGEYDRRRIIHEMCFKTKEGAIAKAGEWLKILGGGK